MSQFPGGIFKFQSVFELPRGAVAVCGSLPMAGLAPKPIHDFMIPFLTLVDDQSPIPAEEKTL